jgi:hypothetical protein
LQDQRDEVGANEGDGVGFWREARVMGSVMHDYS